MDVDGKTSIETVRLRPGRWQHIWNWAFNLAIYGLLLIIVFNRNRIAVRARLSADSSIFGNLLLLLVLLAFILLLTSAVHELGHLLAGRLANLQFHLLFVGPLRISRENGRLRIGFSRNFALFNGMAASLPRDSDNLRKRMLAFALGGPLASLLLALAASAAFWLWRDDGSLLRWRAWQVEMTAVVALVSFIFFLTSIKPGIYQNGFWADGGRIFTLSRGGLAAERWCALVALNGADIGGQRPRDWNSAWVAQALSVTDGSYDDLTAYLIGYQWALDKGRIEEAQRYLEAALKTRSAWLTGLRARLALEKAYLLSRYHQDPATARTWLDQVRPGRTAQPLYWRALAAVLLAEGNQQEARQKAERGLRALAERPFSGIVVAERDWLHELTQLAANSQ